MFGDDVVVVAVIDRLVHHAEVVALRRQLPTQGPRPRSRPRSRNNRRMKINTRQGGQIPLAEKGSDFSRR